MTEVQEAESLDGRVARRQRNIDAVLDVVLDMFAEDAMFPTIEEAAKRSGLSLRSLYRYFADPGELLEAAIARSEQIGAELSRLHAIGEGPLDRRIDAFVTMRLELHEAFAPTLRATLANAARHPRVGDQLARDRDRMHDQFRLQFAPELAALADTDRATVTAAGDLLTQLESIEYLRRHRRLSSDECRTTLTASLLTLLG